jgi:hypothetical protein
MVQEALSRGRKTARGMDLRDIVEIARSQTRKMPDVDMSDMARRGRKQAERIDRERAARGMPQPAFMGLGLGGLVAVAGVCYIVWRLLGRDSSQVSQSDLWTPRS